MILWLLTKELVTPVAGVTGLDAVCFSETIHANKQKDHLEMQREK